MDKRVLISKWCPDSESNQGHEDFQSSALPTELSGRCNEVTFKVKARIKEILTPIVKCFRP